MSSPRTSLAARHADLTQRLILDAAVELLETTSVAELSVRAVAKRAEISERTVFRYFAAREDLLDAVAAEVARRTQAPPNPRTVTELLVYPEAIFARYEETAALTLAAMHSELFPRIRTTDAERRGGTIRALVDREAADRPERERRLAAANIHYHVVATTWSYYRFNFGFPLEDAVQCARMAIRQTLVGLGIDVDAASS
jgi:AcrR family transcriptional regulator